MTDDVFLRATTFSGETVQFDSFKTALFCARDVVESWSDFLEESQNQLRNEFVHSVKTLNKSISGLRNTPAVLNGETDEDAQQQLKMQLNSIIANGDCGLAVQRVFSSTIRSIYSQLGYVSAVAAFHTAHHRGMISGMSQLELLGVIAYTNSVLGVSENSAISVKRALSESLESAEQRFGEILDRSDDQLTALQRVNDEAVAQNERSVQLEAAKVADYREQREIDRNDFSVRVDDQIERLEETRKTYIEYMALEAPANYWSEKANNHRNMAFVFSAAAAVFAGIGGWVLFLVFSATISDFSNITDPVGNDSNSVWMIVFVAAKGLLLSTIYLWAVRILVRLFLSEVHLGMDARERFTMVQCYLALKKDGVTNDDSLKVVLEALFRPTQDGIVKDDASTDPMMAALLRLKQ